MERNSIGRTLIAAEIGTAHGGSPQKARELIDAAAGAGADFVKFQWVYAREILHPATGAVPLPGGLTPLYDVFRSLECPPEFYADAASYARSRGVKFMCSPFGPQSLDELCAIEPDAVKIASPELNHYPLLRRLAAVMTARAESGKAPILVAASSGVSTLAGIEAALAVLKPACPRLALLHCVTAYPAPEDEYNLRLIAALGGIFGIQTGVSDHSLDPALVPALSVCAGAKIIEKHITLSRNAGGLDDPVALEPAAFKTMTRAVRRTEKLIADDGAARAVAELGREFGGQRIERVLGDGVKRLARAEADNYGRTNRSLRYVRALKKGHALEQDDFAALRTEKILAPGISPAFYEFAAGKRLARDRADGDPVRLEDFCD